MTIPFIDKPVYIMLTNPHGQKFEPTRFSIQNAVFKKDGQYEVTCLAAQSDELDEGAVRQGKYTVKENQNDQVILVCDEETGQFPGKYEITFNLLNNQVGQFQSSFLKDRTLINGVFEISR